MGHTCPDIRTYNAVSEYLDADKNGNRNRKKACLEFIGQHFEDPVLQDDLVKRLGAEQLRTIIQSPQLIATTQSLFDTVLRWARRDYSRRGYGQLEMLLAQIPFAVVADPEREKHHYFHEPVIRDSSRLRHLMRELWARGMDQRPRPLYQGDTDNREWHADITNLVTRPIESKSQSFFFVRQGYVFEVKATTTTRRYFEEDDDENGGLEVFLRVLRAESGWTHSINPLRELHVEAAFWIDEGRGRGKGHRKTHVRHFQQDLMVDYDYDDKGSRRSGGEQDWYGFPALVSRSELRDISSRRGGADKVWLGMRVDISKIRTSTRKDSDSEKTCTRPAHMSRGRSRSCRLHGEVGRHSRCISMVTEEEEEEEEEDRREREEKRCHVVWCCRYTTRDKSPCPNKSKKAKEPESKKMVVCCNQSKQSTTIVCCKPQNVPNSVTCSKEKPATAAANANKTRAKCCAKCCTKYCPGETKSGASGGGKCTKCVCVRVCVPAEQVQCRRWSTRC